MRNRAYRQGDLPTRVVLLNPGRAVRRGHSDEAREAIEARARDGVRTLTTKLMQTNDGNRENLAVAAKEPPAATKAARLELGKKARVEDAIAVVLAACLNHLRANEAVALEGADPEGIHEMRVALRRMRAALSDFRKSIPAAQVAWMKRGEQVAHNESQHSPRLGRLSMRVAGAG